MIQDLLDTVIFQSGERLRLRLSNFDIREVAREVCVQSIASHGPRFEVMGESITGWWDRNAIKRALENLIDNAVKYGVPDKPILIKFRAYHERLQLSVQNQGDPIPLINWKVCFRSSEGQW
jgi:signal transduction histidine kinase